MRITIDLPGPPEVTVKALDDAAALLLRVAGMKRNGKPLDGCIMLKEGSYTRAMWSRSTVR